MSKDVLKDISQKYCPRFGLVAVEMGFISKEQLKEAMICQVEEDISGKTHRLLGTILFDKEWMTSEQIELVLNKLLQSSK